MFGFSLAELLVVCVIALIFIRPKDLPEIAHFVGKVFYRGKKFFQELKAQFKEVEQDLGLEEIKNELNRGIAEEKAKLEDEATVIVDIYGNEHRVPDSHKNSLEKSSEEFFEEVKRLNEENLTKKNP
ncbi:MAG: hypothetical protein EBS06_02975 [Proteobacteria bacterium]|nr:hypothetical protein [Pseudomonadota bacterium]